MKKREQISIVIPVHNTFDYLRKCVESVRNQSLREIEIILVDNLSSDGSSALCDEYASLDSRIKAIHLSEAGLSMARNAGVQLASAPYVGFLDSDDYVDPHMYEALLDGITTFDTEMAYCNFCIEKASGETIYPDPNSGETLLRTSDEVLREMLADRISCSACTKLFRKSFLQQFRFPEGVLYEDRKALHEWVACCDRLVWIDRSFYHYVERSSSICHTVSPKNRYHWFLAEHARLQFIGEHPSLFDPKALSDVRSKTLRTCLSLLRDVVMLTSRGEYKEEIHDMRAKLRGLKLMSGKRIDDRTHKRLLKVLRFWPLYYFVHFYFKRKKTEQ